MRDPLGAPSTGSRLPLPASLGTLGVGPGSVQHTEHIVDKQIFLEEISYLLSAYATVVAKYWVGLEESGRLRRRAAAAVPRRGYHRRRDSLYRGRPLGSQAALEALVPSR